MLSFLISDIVSLRRNTMFENYIFDLYATLVSVRTDQTKPGLWRMMAARYRDAGAVWKPSDMQKAYRRMIAEEEKKLMDALNVRYPEPDLRIVFRRLYEEAPGRIIGSTVPESWFIDTMRMFRLKSRVRLRNYHDTHAVLQRLSDEGRKLYLLTNAEHEFTAPEIEEMDLTKYFEEIRMSSDYHMRKPEPKFLMDMITDHHMAPEQTVMIGNDICSDIKAADACGISSVYLNTWHFDDERIKELMKQEIRYPERVRIIRSGRLNKL